MDILAALMPRIAQGLQDAAARQAAAQARDDACAAALAGTVAEAALALGTLQAMRHHPKNLMATWENDRPVLWALQAGKGHQTARALPSPLPEGTGFSATWSAHQKMAWSATRHALDQTLERLAALTLRSPGMAAAARVSPTSHRVGLATHGQGRHFLPAIGPLSPHGSLLQHHSRTGLGQRWAQAWLAGLDACEGDTFLVDPQDGRRRACPIPGHPAVWAPWLAKGVEALCPHPRTNRPATVREGRGHHNPTNGNAGALWETIDAHWAAMVRVAQAMPWGVPPPVAVLNKDGTIDASRVDRRWPDLITHGTAFLHALAQAIPAIRPSRFTPTPGFLLGVRVPHRPGAQVGVIHLLGAPVRLGPHTRPSERLAALTGITAGDIACIEHAPYPRPTFGQGPHALAFDGQWQPSSDGEGKLVARVHATGHEAASFLSRANLSMENGADIHMVDKERGTPEIGFGLDNVQEGYATSTVFGGAFTGWDDAEAAAKVLIARGRRQSRTSTFWTQPW